MKRLEQARDKHSGGPCDPRDGAEEGDEGEDRYEKRNERMARGKGEEVSHRYPALETARGSE